MDNNIIIKKLSDGISQQSSQTINELLPLIQERIIQLQNAINQYGLHETQTQYLNRSVETLQKFFKTNDMEENELKEGFMQIAEATKNKDINALREALVDWKERGFKSERTSQIQNMLKRYHTLQETSQDIFDQHHTLEFIQLQMLIQDTYKFLNLVGETVRGRQIFYEVNYINEKTKQIFSGYLTLDQILQYSTITSNGQIKLNTSLLKQGFKNQEFITQEWNSQRSVSFWNFQKRALQNEKNENLRIYSVNENEDKDYLNLGNVMEAFRYGEQLLLERVFPDINDVYNAINKAHWKRVYAWMNRTIRNIDSYLKGGDIEANLKLLFQNDLELLDKLMSNNIIKANESIVDLQLKNINAGLTNINSLMVQLIHLQNILLKSQNKNTTIQQLLSSKHKEETIEQEIIKDFKNMFSQIVTG